MSSLFDEEKITKKLLTLLKIIPGGKKWES